MGLDDRDGNSVPTHKIQVQAPAVMPYTLRCLCAQPFVLVSLYNLLLATYPIPSSDVRGHQVSMGCGCMSHQLLGLRE